MCVLGVLLSLSFPQWHTASVGGGTPCQGCCEHDDTSSVCWQSRTVDDGIEWLHRRVGASHMYGYAIVPHHG